MHVLHMSTCRYLYIHVHAIYIYIYIYIYVVCMCARMEDMYECSYIFSTISIYIHLTIHIYEYKTEHISTYTAILEYRYSSVVIFDLDHKE